MSRPLVIYHSPCHDGWCSAWMMDRALGGVELWPAQYGDSPPPVDGRTVIIVDFSYDRETMLRMHREAHDLIVLDHHKSAKEDCADLPFCIFDMERSGAGLAYWWLHDRGYIQELQVRNETRDIARGMRPLMEYVEDRDLFRFALDSSETINAAIRSYPWELEVWDHLAKRMQVTPMALLTEGEAIQRYRKQIVASHVGQAIEVEIADVRVPATFCTSADIISDVGGELAKENCYFAAVICWTTDGRLLVSLRSDPSGMDVSEIARKFGGGGHARAAGFRLPFEQLQRMHPQLGVLCGSLRSTVESAAGATS